MTKEVVLIYPHYKDLVTEAEGILEPLSLTYLAGYLKKHNVSVSIIDLTADNISLKELGKIIREKNPKLVGLHANIPLVLKAVQVAKVVKEVNKDIKIIVGGHQATFLPRETLENFDCFDIVAIGEGERTLLELVRELDKERPCLNKIKGIGYRQSNKVVITPERELIENLDSIPFPSRELINFSHYRPPTKAYYSKPFATMLTSRGCPFHCIFCAYADGVCRLRSPENIIEEIRGLINDYNVKSILFYDDTLTFDRERLMKICELIIKNRFDIKWTCYSRVNAVNLELLKMMRSAGCELISYGVESGSQEMLNMMKKGITLDQVVNAVKLTKIAGIRSSASYVLGIPGETLESISQTIEFAKKLDTTFAHFNMITPWPGTELYEELLRNNKISKDEWKEYARKLGMHIPTIDLGDMTTDELRKVPVRAYRTFYLRPRKILELAKTAMSLLRIKSYILALKSLVKLR